jgi:integration host factor subunit alpha
MSTPLMELAVETLETPALTKAQLADLLFEQIGLNKRESKDMIDAFFDLVTDSLVNGTDVKISGFGNFQIRTKAPRPGRNPRTGEPVAIEAQAQRPGSRQRRPRLSRPWATDPKKTFAGSRQAPQLRVNSMIRFVPA